MWSNRVMFTITVLCLWRWMSCKTKEWIKNAWLIFIVIKTGIRKNYGISKYSENIFLVIFDDFKWWYLNKLLAIKVEELHTQTMQTLPVNAFREDGKFINSKPPKQFGSSRPSSTSWTLSAHLSSTLTATATAPSSDRLHFLTSYIHSLQGGVCVCISSTTPQQTPRCRTLLHTPRRA